MTERMTYADLVQYVADLTLTSRSDVLALTRNLIQVIKLGLDRDGRISVPGLGRFELKWHAARQGFLSSRFRISFSGKNITVQAVSFFGK